MVILYGLWMREAGGREGRQEESVRRKKGKELRGRIGNEWRGRKRREERRGGRRKGERREWEERGSVGVMRKEKEESRKGGVGRRGGHFHYVNCAPSSQGGDSVSAAGQVDTPSESPLTVTAEVRVQLEDTLAGLTIDTWAVI